VPPRRALEAGAYARQIQGLRLSPAPRGGGGGGGGGPPPPPPPPHGGITKRMRALHACGILRHDFQAMR
ncbi:hypothetical protein, partial [Caballeronia sp. INSB1]|uniref:hypothetical protein n=1 Tax=Caballeronia sp. INSB1 TaxID=2921751 RepID=UPI00203230BE